MTTPENNNDLQSLFADVNLDERDREILLIADIQNLLLDLTQNLPDQSSAHDQHRSYEFGIDALLSAKLPAAIQDMLSMGYDATAYLQFNIDKTEKFTSISLSFELSKVMPSTDPQDPKEHVLTTHIGTTLEPAHGNIPSKIINHLDGAVLNEKDAVSVISEQEIYEFLASIAGKDDDNLAFMFIDHPDQFSTFLHNPFAFNYIHGLINQRAIIGHKQDQYALDDPEALAELTVTYMDDELARIELELWNSYRKEGFPITIDHVIEKAELAAETPIDENGISFDFGDGSSTLEYAFPDSPLVFQIGYNVYQPPVDTLEEIKQRLMNTIDHISNPTDEIPYEEPAEDDMDTDPDRDLDY